MHPTLDAFLRTHHHAITTAEAASIGLNREVVRGLVQRGVLTRVARGAYVQTSVLIGAEHEDEKHRLRARALLRSRPEAWAASHQTAVLLWGLPLPQAPLARLHVCHTRPTGTSRRRETYSVHLCPRPAEFRQVDTLLVQPPAAALVGAALQTPRASAVAAIDAALRLELVTATELDRALADAARVPRVAGARLAVALADGRSESPGESLLRLVLADLGFTAVPQYLIRDGEVVIARVDFYLPTLGVVLEFDGRLKYAGGQGARALTSEKTREDRIRALGYGVGRVTWGDLRQPEAVRRCVLTAARSARPELLGHRPEAG